MTKPKLIVFPAIDEKKRALFINNELVNLSINDDLEIGEGLIYSGILTVGEQKYNGETRYGYSYNLPEEDISGFDPENIGELDPMHTKFNGVLDFCWYSETENLIIYNEGSYLISKIEIGEEEFEIEGGGIGVSNILDIPNPFPATGESVEIKLYGIYIDTEGWEYNGVIYPMEFMDAEIYGWDNGRLGVILPKPDGGEAILWSPNEMVLSSTYIGYDRAFGGNTLVIISDKQIKEIKIGDTVYDNLTHDDNEEYNYVYSYLEGLEENPFLVEQLQRISVNYNTIVYEGSLTPEWLDEHEEIIGYSNWSDSEYGEHGTINPIDENILHLCYYDDRAYSGGAIIIVGYHLTKIKIGEEEFDNYSHAIDGDGNEGTVFENVGETSPFDEGVSVDVIFYY